MRPATSSMGSGTAPEAEGEGVDVALGSRSYRVVIAPGVLRRAAAHIAPLAGRCVVVCDENVAPLHLEALEAALAAGGLHRGSIVVPPGEVSKSMAEMTRLCGRLLDIGLERGDLVIALGGGVIGDLAGFAASIVRRGVRYVQIPTTLLAQVDSSVGGKTGVNTARGKNLLGTFHQPSLVLADTDTLATLPERQMRAGYAEVVKYGLLGDAAFFEWLEASRRDVLAREPRALRRAVAHSVRMKAGIVARDETETGERALLNLGHTFGHALEAWCGYSGRLLHGEAVAIGMCLAFELSAELGLCHGDIPERVAAHVRAAGLPTRIHDVPGAGDAGAEPLLDLMRQDKKVRDGKLAFILARGIGQATIFPDLAHDLVRDFLARHISRG